MPHRDRCLARPPRRLAATRLVRLQERGIPVAAAATWNSKKTFDVDVTLNQGAWQKLGMRVVTSNGAPPIGIPAPAS